MLDQLQRMLLAQHTAPGLTHTTRERLMSEREAIEIAGVRLTSPEKVLYDEQGITKRELAEYYLEIAGWIVPQVKDRPLTLIRCPQGQERYCFVQRRASEGFPSYIRRVAVDVEGEAEEATHIAAVSLQGIVYLTQIGALELHTWGARRDRLDRPDRMIFDLDPDPTLPFSSVVDAALQIRARLDDLGLKSFVKTSGGKGLHVVVPITRGPSWDDVRGFSHALAEEMESRDPDHFVAEASKAERGGRVYIDYLRNAWAASAVAAYSTRSKPGAPVSTPLSWEEVADGPRPADLNVRSIPERLRKLRHDPWEGYGQTRQSLTKSIRARLGLS